MSLNEQMMEERAEFQMKDRLEDNDTDFSNEMDESDD